MKDLNFTTLFLIGLGGFIVYKMVSGQSAPAASAAPSLTQTAQSAANQAATNLINQASNAISSIGVGEMPAGSLC